MSAKVEDRLNRVLKALASCDYDMARSVRHGDRSIDEMQNDIEEQCMRVLALSHPVAGDLRLILAVLRINGELERIGDQAKSIAKRLLALENRVAVTVPDALLEMARRVQQMVSDTIGALADENADAGRRVRRDDERVDDLYREIFAWIHEEIPAHVERTESAIDILSIARKLERTADHATNIAEDVIFLVEGAVVRHTAT
jgi:phosphate transport system protein